MKVKLVAKKDVNFPLSGKWFCVKSGSTLDGTMVDGLICLLLEDPDEGKTYEIFRRSDVEANFYIERMGGDYYKTDVVC